jgi:branched-chain amino acid transport system permease protein
MMAVMGGMQLLGRCQLRSRRTAGLSSSLTVNWMSFVGMLFVAIVLLFRVPGFIRRKSDS